MKSDLKTLLAAEQLSVGYRRKSAAIELLSNVNLSLLETQLICLMGPNGSGKSSLLRTLAGLQRPLSGHILFHDVGTTAREHQIAVVLTERISTPNLTVREVITFGRYPYLGWNIRLSTRDHQLIQNAIEQVRIQPLLEKKLYELSDGQLQMAMIARALAQDTPILLLDEPTAHLDLNNRVEIMNLLRYLSRTMNKSILVATHELDLALQTADVIWLTGSSGRVIQGIPEDLVLNGTFDEVFRFKGFDLRSGKVLQHAFRETAIQLKGDGSAYLWTKNALERNGFEVTHAPQPNSVTVVQDSPVLRWKITQNNQSAEVDSIEKLMELL